MKPTTKVPLLVILLFSHLPFLFAQPGTLSSSFGVNGLLLNPARETYEKAIATLPDKEMVIGSSGFYHGFTTFMIDCTLPDGSNNFTFGTSGTTFINFTDEATSSFVTAGINAITVQPDGKIVAAGYGAGSVGTIALARFLPTGLPDSSFGSHGTSLTSFYADDIVNAVALQPDGKIVVCGQTELDVATYNYYFFTARYLSDGSIDESFGNKGIVVSNSLGNATALALQPDGKIVAAGYSNGISGINFHTERYNANGGYDNSFGTAGITDHAVAGGFLNFINDVALQGDGKIVVAGRSNGTGNQSFTVMRYNSDGSFDNSFNGSGLVTTVFANKTGVAEKIMMTGEKGNNIVVAGNDFDPVAGGDFVLVAYLPDGTLDSSFGNAGIQITDFGGTDFDHSAALRSDGKMVLLGSNLGQYTNTVRALALYNGYALKTPLSVRIKRWLQNHNIEWKGLPAEDRIAYYSIEQSPNSRTGFTEIASINGRSNLPDYSLINSHLLQGINYYRIKAVSTDGTIRYSEVASADNTVASVSLFPNPALDYVLVNGLQTTGTSNISLRDGGNNVLIKGVSNGSPQYRMPISYLQPGTYYVTVSYSNKTEILKLVKGSK